MTLSAIYPSLAARRVLVTGGGSGIGASIVEAFVRQGATVWFLDCLVHESHGLVERLADARGAVHFLHCDLTVEADLDAALVQVIREAGHLDVLVNNAANDMRHSLQDLTPAIVEASFAVNLRHLVTCSQAAAGGMRAAGGGAIINLGSVSWHLALPDLPLYEMAKAGIEGLTRALARDLGGFGIRVNCVVPGGIRTPKQTRLWHGPDEEARMLAQQCLKERVDPEHVAAMILFLASDDGRMCTAHNYFVDAGWR